MVAHKKKNYSIYIILLLLFKVNCFRINFCFFLRLRQSEVKLHLCPKKKFLFFRLELYERLRSTYSFLVAQLRCAPLPALPFSKTPLRPSVLLFQIRLYIYIMCFGTVIFNCSNFLLYILFFLCYSFVVLGEHYEI